MPFSGKNAKSLGPGRQLCRCHFDVGNSRSPATLRARTTVSDPAEAVQQCLEHVIVS